MATATFPDRSIVPSAPSFASGIADPGPLGLAAFAMTTFFLSTVNAGLLPESLKPVVLGLALFYGGIVQVLAGMWEFVKGNTFGALAFSSYGAFWLAFWYLNVNIANLKIADPANPGALLANPDAKLGVGIFLLGWTIFTLYMLVVTFKINNLLVVVFGLLFVTFVFLTLGDLMPSTTMTHVGGYFGLATAAAAWYGSMAGVMNATVKRVLLPVGPRS